MSVKSIFVEILFNSVTLFVSPPDQTPDVYVIDKFSEGDRGLSIHPENGQVPLFYKKENLILVLENSRLYR